MALNLPLHCKDIVSTMFLIKLAFFLFVSKLFLRLRDLKIICALIFLYTVKTRLTEGFVSIWIKIMIIFWCFYFSFSINSLIQYNIQLIYINNITNNASSSTKPGRSADTKLWISGESNPTLSHNQGYAMKIEFI